MQRGLAHDSTLADLAALHFKLRLDQQNHISVRGQERGESGNQKRERNEAGVAHRQVELLREIRCREVAGVNALLNHYARVGAQFPIDLSVTNIESPDFAGSALQ